MHAIHAGNFLLQRDRWVGRSLRGAAQRSVETPLKALGALVALAALHARSALSTLSALGVAAIVAASPAQATSLRIASAFDPQTMDPHALALLYHSRIAFQVHESLVGRDEKFKTEPALATAWQMTSPTTWRFRLRPGVKFHDGSAFTADDAVFSLERTMAPPSQRAFQLKGVKAVKKVDELTIEFQLEAPDAVLPEKLQFISMMSKAWAEKHGVVKAQDFNAKQETYTVRNANGTGPFRLESFQPDVRVLLKRHDAWWGWAEKGADGKPRHGNLTEVSFVPIRSDATRLAALASGEIDLVMDPPYQDITRLKSDARIA
ncbi:MAG: hypothetical protein JNN03_16575, partial [Rubrivivax sp.]|nr:hypothetical protein [Rubrivivax sp.]